MKTCSSLWKENTCGAGKYYIKKTYRPLKASDLRTMTFGEYVPSGERKIREVCESWRPDMPALALSKLCNTSRTDGFVQCAPGWTDAKKGICRLQFIKKEYCEKGCKERSCNPSGKNGVYLRVVCSEFVGCSDKNAVCYEMNNGTLLCGFKPEQSSNPRFPSLQVSSVSNRIPLSSAHRRNSSTPLPQWTARSVFNALTFVLLVRTRASNSVRIVLEISSV